MTQAVMPKVAPRKISERPNFRPGKIMCVALHLYNEETVHTNSQTMRMALKRLIPQKYFEQAAKLVGNKATA